MAPSRWSSPPRCASRGCCWCSPTSSSRLFAKIFCVFIGLAGLLLAAFPRMDHPWLDALENAAPAVQEAFLTPGERATRRDSAESIAAASAELARLRALEQDVRWGSKPMDAERQERLRQYLAGRSELLAGDQLVLKTLRAKAREWQRYALGMPLLLLGGVGFAVLARRAWRAAPRIPFGR